MHSEYVLPWGSREGAKVIAPTYVLTTKHITNAYLDRPPTIGLSIGLDCYFAGVAAAWIRAVWLVICAGVTDGPEPGQATKLIKTIQS